MIPFGGGGKREWGRVKREEWASETPFPLLPFPFSPKSSFGLKNPTPAARVRGL
jgi:hypothetical protein